MKRSFLFAAFVGCLSFSCATSTSNSASVRAGDGDEAPVPVLDAERRNWTEADHQPTEDELASAFDGPATTFKERSDGTGNVPTWEPPPDPLEGQRAAFEEAARAVRAQVQARSPDAVSGSAALVTQGGALGPAYEQRARELQVDAAIATKQKGTIAQLALAWLRACGPEQADACRRKALQQFSRNLKHAPDAARKKKQAAALAEADACLRRAEKGARSGKLPDCLNSTEREYRRLDDDRMVARVHLARARTLAAKEPTYREAVRAWEKAAAVCTSPRCSDLQRAALQQLAEHHLQRNDPEAAARAALREAALNAASLNEAQRPWAWTELTSRACQAYDAAKGEGRCRKLERELNGKHAFRNFAQSSSRTVGLSVEVVREVNAHFGFTLQSCLTQQAARLVPPAEERYDVSWVVHNDGRVIDMKMGRRDRQEAPLARCLREKLATWRYPRYEGEFQHVQQQFIVTARAPFRSL